MAHIPGFYLENFRVFEKPQTFRFSAINILTGTNNSGKSSLLKAMMLLKENMQKEKFPRHLSFSGNNHRLASFDVMASNPSKNCVNMGIPFDWHKPLLERKGKKQENWVAIITYRKPHNSSTQDPKLHSFKIIELETQTTLIEIIYETKEVSLDLQFDIKNSAKMSFNWPLLIKINNWFGIKKTDKPSRYTEISPDNRMSVFEYTVNTYYSEDKDFYIKPKEPGKENLSRHSEGCVFFEHERFELFEQPLLKYRKLDKTSNLSEDDIKTIIQIERKAINNFANGKSGFQNNREFIHKLTKKLDPIGYYYCSNYSKDPETISPYLLDNFVLQQPNRLFGIFEFLFYEVLYLLYTDNNEHDFFLDLSFYKREPYLDHRESLLGNEMIKLENFFNDLVNYFEKLFLETTSSLDYIPSARISLSRIFEVNKTSSDIMSRILFHVGQANLQKEDVEYYFLNKWIVNFGIADELIIEFIEGANAKLLLRIKNKVINIADHGFGSTQVLSVLLQIAIQAKLNSDTDIGYLHYKSIIIIEEPEANLHPKLQSMLADMFVDAASKFNIQFIVETHSEYLIRKLQYLTANREHEYHIKPKHTTIFYCNNPKNPDTKKKQQVQIIKIREDGILDGGFGTGFFDEASNLIKDIFKISGAN